MDVPTKLRLLKQLGKIFPLWSMNLQANVVSRAFDPQLEAAKKANDRAEFESLLSQRGYETQEFLEKAKSIRSVRLCRKAGRYFFPTATLEWEQSEVSGVRYLSERSESELYRAVQDARQKAWEFYIKVILAAATLVATATSLVLALKK